MNSIGVVVEYNPFHNGHLYHLEYIKNKYPNDTIIAIMSGNFMQRGQVSLISKWEKTRMALYNGVDIVLDLPFVFANESADFFAENSIKILNHFRVDKIIFGSESNNTDLYYELAKVQLYDEKYHDNVKEFLKKGYNYPTACSMSLKEINCSTINLPNDILGLAYTKAIIKNEYNIEIEVVKRSNDFHSLEIDKISSATSIRNAILNDISYEIAVPKHTRKIILDSFIYNNEMFYKLLQYKIISSSILELKKIHLVEEGIEIRVKKAVLQCNTFEDLVKTVSSKRYTFSRTSRMLMNILLNYTTKEHCDVKDSSYNRVIGFSSRGRKYLKHLNKCGVCYDVSIKHIDNVVSNVEFRASKVLKLVNEEYNEQEKIIFND